VSEDAPVSQFVSSLDASLPNTLKLIAFPLKRNNILLRLENVADNFDVNVNDTVLYFKIKDYAANLYNTQNGNRSTLSYINVYETSLTANQPYTDMLANKIKWYGADDANVTEPAWPRDRADFEVALQPQRIRVFDVEFIPTLNVTLSLIQ